MVNTCYQICDIYCIVIITYCREILDDSNFYEALQQISNEPTPYFSQFSNSQIISTLDKCKADTSIPVYTAGVCGVSEELVPKTFETHQDSEILSTSSDDYKSRTPLATK